MINTSNLFLEAKNSATKVLQGKEFTVSDLESIFKLYWFSKKALGQTLSQNTEDIKNKIIRGVTEAVNELSDYLLDSLKMWKESFVEILIDDLLFPANWKKSGQQLEKLLTNPNELLAAERKLKDTDAVNTINSFLIWKIIDDIVNADKKYFEKLDTNKLQNLSDKINGLWYLDKNTKERINNLVQNCIFWKLSPEIDKYINEFNKVMTDAISKCDTDIDIKWYKDKFIALVRNLENQKIVRWSHADTLLQQCKSKFETQFDKLVCDLISQVINKKFKEELENCDSVSDIDQYLKWKYNAYWVIMAWLWELNNEDSGKKLKSTINDMIKNARITCKSKPPKVKIAKDKYWDEYAFFKNEEFPVSKHKTLNHTWKIEPKILENWNVLITFRDVKSWNVIEPSDWKRLRLENPYEVTKEEYKEILNQMKAWHQTLKEICNIKEKLKATTDTTEKSELQKKLGEYIEKLPFFMKVADKLRLLDNFCWNYVESKIPDFDPDTIKITPDVMENLREIAECAKTMLLWQKDILIIEWEAWVWKNVLIDIFAHFTNRPVFVFACGKKTDSHDLTYQWILDEKGSKKLNSKIYEAIHTPWSILVLDEINTMDAWTQKRLNALFDKRKELVCDEAWAANTKALSDVLIFGTMNPVSYEWTQKLADDVSSRSHFIFHDYDWMFNEDWVSYSDALRIYWNVNYFWKLSSWNSMRKGDVELYEQALLDLKLWKKLTKDKEAIMKRFKPLSDADFIWSWNQLFGWWNENEVKNRFWNTFVEGMKDIYQIVLFSNYIRMRHKACKLWIDSDGLPRNEDTNDLFEEKSFSPRLAIQALEQLNNGNEIHSARQAVIKTYIQQISEVDKRDKLIKFFNTLSDDQIEKQLKDKNVKWLLYSKTI